MDRDSRSFSNRYRVGLTVRVIPTPFKKEDHSQHIIEGMANIASDLASGQIRLVGKYSTARANTSFIPAAIIANKKVGPGPKLVYSKLLTYAWANETATLNRLAADLAVSPRSVRNYIAALKSAGFLEVRLHPGKPSSYKLTTAH